MKQSAKDETEGNLQELKGAVKEKVSQITNRSYLSAEGQNEEIAGQIQEQENVGQIEKVVDKLWPGRRKEDPMLLILIVLVLVLGGGGGFYGHSRWGYGGSAGIGLGTILLILLVADVLGPSAEAKPAQHAENQLEAAG